MKINAVFQGKQLSMEEAPCEVRKIITLPDKEFVFFKKHLMYDYDFLRKNKDQMGFHNGIRQCVLVMGESSEDGVLVDSSGYDYARYTAPFLGARSYMTLREQNLQANGEPKTLTADDLVILHAKHTLWVYGVGGEQGGLMGLPPVSIGVAAVHGPQRIGAHIPDSGTVGGDGVPDAGQLGHHRRQAGQGPPRAGQHDDPAPDGIGNGLPGAGRDLALGIEQGAVQIKGDKTNRGRR